MGTVSTCEGPAAEQPPSERGQRIAAWLEEIGLADQLDQAGLPTYRRDADGLARWTDPVTSADMSEEQLEALEKLLRSEGSDPEHAVPLQLVQLARKAKVRAALLESPWFTYDTLAAVRGASVNATRFAVHKSAADNRLLVVAHEARTLVPAFQLDPQGEVRPELVDVLAPLLAAGMDPWSAWAWLTQPAALLGGAVPEQAATDPEEAPVVRHAAVRLAERVATS